MALWFRILGAGHGAHPAGNPRGLQPLTVGADVLVRADNPSSLVGKQLQTEWMMAALAAQSTGCRRGFQSLSAGDSHGLAEHQVGEQGGAGGQPVGCWAALVLHSTRSVVTLETPAGVPFTHRALWNHVGKLPKCSPKCFTVLASPSPRAQLGF